MNPLLRLAQAVGLAAAFCAAVLPARADSETRYMVTIQTQVGGQLVHRVDSQGAATPYSLARTDPFASVA